MAGRDELLAEDFVEHLRAHVQGFSAETERIQWHLARVAWQGALKRRQHRTEAGAMTFSYNELEQAFGRGKFGRVIREIDFFRRSAGWSQRDATTRAYWFSEQVREAQATYRATRRLAPTRLLWLSGEKVKVARSLPSAISSTDTNGRTTRTSDWDRAKGMNRVPVDIEMLTRLQRWLQETLAKADELDPPLQRFMERLLDITAKIITMAATDLGGPGHILQVYSIAPTGRLYASGLNLQNAPGLVKEAALHGLWEYDFSNCHFSIVAQMAGKFGVACPLIEHYLANKVHVRQEIAQDAVISIDQAKQCLLALLYGARPSGRARDAIPAAIGVEAARRLYAQPTFDALRLEIDRARGAILRGWRRTANGSLTNACGKAIRGNAKPAGQLAHLVQGVEAKALMAIVNLHAEDIVLLQHDGFAAHKRLDCEALQSVVFDQVGYWLTLEEQQLQLHEDARALMSRTKSEMASDAAPAIDP